MKKIILSVAVAAMALSTTASALEDIKVDGQAKLWYETSDTATTLVPGSTNDSLFHKDASQASVVFKLGMTGKQGNVGFGAEMTQVSTMGLENVLVTNVRHDATSGLNPAAYVSKAYFTAPIAGATLKMGRQELSTPLLFTEKWNAVQNNFDAAVVIVPATDNLTVIGAYAGQTNTGITAPAFKAAQSFSQIGTQGSYALGALYKADALAVNVWAYEVSGLAKAFWADAGMKAGPVNVKAYASMIMPNGSGTGAGDDTTGFALCANTDLGGVKVAAAGSMVMEDGQIALANLVTGKKTKLPTAGIYTDGVYVAQPGSTAFKLKASGKVGTTGLALQAVMNTNSDVRFDTGTGGANIKDTTEVDFIVTQKLGDFNLKGILMHRSFDDSGLDDTNGGIHARVIASVNF